MPQGGHLTPIFVEPGDGVLGPVIRLAACDPKRVVHIGSPDYSDSATYDEILLYSNETDTNGSEPVVEGSVSYKLVEGSQ